jgi:sugar diacid utilization regulator
MRAPDECPEGGTIMLEQSDGRRLNVLDAKVVRRAAAMVDVIVRAETNEAECMRALATDLLLGRDEERIEARASQHGLDLSVPRVVCAFGGGVEAGPLDPKTVAGLLGRATGTPTKLVAAVGSQVAAILVLDQDAPAPEAVERVRQQVAAAVAELPGEGRHAGLSSPCHEADDYKHALDEAGQALDAAAGAAEPVMAIDELGPGRLLTAEIDSARAARFARSVMAPLLEEEDGNGGALIETLQTFFECGRNIRQTAQRLDVHENTVRYRLGSIQRRIGLDVAGNPRDELTVQLALQLLADSQRPVQRGGRFSANAAAPSAASAEWKTGIASSS